LATTITVALFAVFLVRAFLRMGQPEGSTAFGLALHSFIVAVMVALASLLLGERVRVYRWSAVVIGLIGVIVMLSPHLSFGTGSGIAARKWMRRGRSIPALAQSLLINAITLAG
jgi:drug/metabolite transporter (DMT)-like permease